MLVIYFHQRDKLLSSNQTFFKKTLTTIAVISLGFFLFTVTVLAFYIIIPLGQRATDDLANIMTHAAEQWAEMDENERPQFAQEILVKHQLKITQANEILENSNNILPYLFFLRQAIEKHQNIKIDIKQSRDQQNIDWFWMDIPTNNQIVRVGFPRKRIGVQPPLALMIVLLTGLILTVATAILLTRRLTIPVERLYQAAHKIGKGHWPTPIKEEGPEELKILASAFNRMNKQVRELLDNRTTLLSGIAHDLRTPLTQIQLALEMLPKNGGDAELMESIKSDLDNINILIGESLSIGQELAEEQKEEVDISHELENIINNTHQDIIKFMPPSLNCDIKIEVFAFRRVINNLIENAIRYGKGNEIYIKCQCKQQQIKISILDQGDGIPADKLKEVFQPFYRLEQSRGSGTGGSGLGLAVVRQLADSHNWNVELKPRDGLGGTIAEIIIPRT